MNVFFEPKSLTRFVIGNDYEMLNIAGEPLSKKKVAAKNVAFEKKTKVGELERLTGESIRLDGTRYKGKAPTVVRLPHESIEDIMRNEADSSYNPLEDAPSLYTELAKIEYFDSVSLKKFIDNFGLPEGTDLFSSEMYSVCHQELDLFSFYEHLHEYKKALYVYEALQSNDKKALKGYVADYEAYVKDKVKISQKESKGVLWSGGKDKIFERFLQNKKDKNLSNVEALEKVYEEVGNQVKQTPDILKRWSEVVEESPEIQAKHYLIEMLNRWEKGSSSLELIDGQIHPGTTFKSLLEVAYYQLTRAVIGNVKMKRCENETCNALFEVIHEGRHFCPPRPGARISTCQNTYNQRVQRRKIKDKQKAADLAADGVAVQQIADELNRDQEEIKAWLAEAK